jgi:hypothetical protein
MFILTSFFCTTSSITCSWLDLFLFALYLFFACSFFLACPPQSTLYCIFTISFISSIRCNSCLIFVSLNFLFLWVYSSLPLSTSSSLSPISHSSLLSPLIAISNPLHLPPLALAIAPQTHHKMKWTNDVNISFVMYYTLTKWYPWLKLLVPKLMFDLSMSLTFLILWAHSSTLPSTVTHQQQSQTHHKQYFLHQH